MTPTQYDDHIHFVEKLIISILAITCAVAVADLFDLIDMTALIETVSLFIYARL